MVHTVNFGLLVFWFLKFMAARDWIFSFHGKWFRLAAEDFDRVHYRGMLTFKLGIFLFNLVPYPALRIAG
jgi:hypothetical protein